MITRHTCITIARMRSDPEEQRRILRAVGERLRRSPLRDDVGIYVKGGLLRVVYRPCRDPLALIGTVTRMIYDAARGSDAIR